MRRTHYCIGHIVASLAALTAWAAYIVCFAFAARVPYVGEAVGGGVRIAYAAVALEAQDVAVIWTHDLGCRIHVRASP